MNATLKTGLIALVVLAGVSASRAFAQSYQGNSGNYFNNDGFNYGSGYGYGGIHYGASTVAESYFRGYADLVRAHGESNYYNALAQVQREQAREKRIVNHQAGVQAFFSLRKFNEDQRLAVIAARRPSKEQLVAMSKKAAPKRLNEAHWNVASDGLAWPVVLDRSEFAASRDRLDELFRIRRDAASGLSGDEYQEVQDLAKSMTTELKNLVAEVKPADYVAAKAFLKSVDFEARMDPTDVRIAQN